MALMLSMLATTWLRASTAPETLASFQRTSFGKSDGAPDDILSLAQTSDGFLWMAGTKGLVRFDGVQFKVFKPLPGERFMQAQLGRLFPAENGGLWIQNEDAGPTLLKDGHLIQFGAKDGVVGVRQDFFADPHGTVWAVSDGAVMYFKGDRWHVAMRAGVADGRFDVAAVDGDGNVWIAVRDKGLMVKPHGSNDLLLKAPGPGAGAQVLFIGPSGLLFYSTWKSGLHIYRRDGLKLAEVTLPIPFAIIAGLQSRSGGLWVVSKALALNYLSPQALALAEKDLAAPQPEIVPGITHTRWPVLRDRSGDIWTGGRDGLDRFSLTAFTPVSLPENIHEVSASVDPSGGLWVGNETRNVLHVAPLASSWETTDAPPLTLATFSDPADGTVWGASRLGVWQLSPGKPRLAAKYLLPELGPVPYAVVRDRQGTLFVSWPHTGNGLLAWDGESWHDVLKQPAIVKVMAVDRQNCLWLGGLGRNRLITLSKGVEHEWGEANHLRVGVVRSILPDGDVLWVGGDDGIQFFDGKQFRSLLAKDPEAFQTVTGLIRDATGNLWAQTLDGVMRIPASDVVRALAHPDQPVTYRLFNTTDGVPGAPDADRMLPSLRLSPDGRIWTNTITGLAWIDPAHLPTSAGLPRIVMETVSSDKTTYQVSEGSIGLSPEQSAFRIAYTTPALTHPERVQFSYRLQGFSDWQDVDTRREAVFTNVPAGSYVFQVRAVRAGDAASAVTASLKLTRAPAYYETWWFRALGLLLLAIMFWFAYVLRLQALRRQMHIRVDERERIARDLHDTLLQGVQGLQLRLQTWAASPRLEPAHRQEMADVAIRARDMLIDGRDRIIALRRVDASTNLAGELRAIALDYTTLYHVSFAMDEEGTPRPLITEAALEVVDITREGLRNAFVHAKANVVELHLEWRRHELHILVRDDGEGIEDEVLQNGGRAGHWGLQGMRERTDRIGARMLLGRGDERGTELSLVVPGRVIYGDTSWRIWRRLRRSGLECPG
jgi:signal transduction histidine kinase/ligand-binding sensor domain-containing protein